MSRGAMKMNIKVVFIHDKHIKYRAATEKYVGFPMQNSIPFTLEVENWLCQEKIEFEEIT